MTNDILEFDFGTDPGMPKVLEILALAAEEGNVFTAFAEAAGANFVKLVAENHQVTLDLEAIEKFASRDHHGRYVGLAETAQALLGLIANPESHTAGLLIYKFRAQLRKLIEAPGTNKRAHRGAPTANAKFRVYKFIPYGECWVVAFGPLHRYLTESMGLNWKSELERFEETGEWSLDSEVGKANRMPAPVCMVLNYRIVDEHFGLSPYCYNVNAVHHSVHHGDADGDGGGADVVLDPAAAVELKAGPVIDGERTTWFEYQKAATLRITGKPLWEATFGEHQTPEPKKLRPGKPVFVSQLDLEAAMVGSITHQVVGIGRKFNHAFVALARASANPTLTKYAEWAYLAGYEVTLGGYDPLDQALIDAMYKAEPERLKQMLLATGNTTEYLNDVCVSDRIVRAAASVAKWGELPPGMPLNAGEINAMWLGWTLRLMANGKLFAPKRLVWDSELGEDVMGLETGRRFLGELVRSQFFADLMACEPCDLPDGIAFKAVHRYLTQMVPTLKGYSDAFTAGAEEVVS